MALSSYRELKVWQLGMDLVERTYCATGTFPNDEQYGLAIQMRRAAVSIPSNIAEGYARQHRKEYLQHLSVSQGSLAELDTQLEIATRLGYVSPERHTELGEHVTALSKQLHSLRRALANRQQEGRPDQ